MRLLSSVLRALTRRPTRRPAAPAARLGLESLESRETPSGGLRPLYYVVQAPQVEVQVEHVENRGGHGGADNAQPHA
jgi:hypothetical protein